MDLEAEFERRGGYLSRRGPAGEAGEPRCMHKLAFAATDREFLIETLYELSLLPECYFVKYSSWEREGMTNGRCLLTDPELVGRLWRRFRAHPKLLCTVQDDGFTQRFRASLT